MKMQLYVIVDVSGRMHEMGKIHLQRNLCRYAAQLKILDKEKYENIEIKFYKWVQDITKLSIKDNGDIPSLISEGSSSLSVLSSFIYKMLNDTGRLKILILSDGNFDNSDIESFNKQLSSFTNLAKLTIGTVAIGADVNLLKLKKISINSRVHLSENISSAIDSTLFGNNLVSHPENTIQILRNKLTEPKETWDD